MLPKATDTVNIPAGVKSVHRILDASLQMRKPQQVCAEAIDMKVENLTDVYEYFEEGTKPELNFDETE